MDYNIEGSVPMYDDMPLEDVFKKIFVKYVGSQAIDHKTCGDKLKAFMLEIIPDYDQERVYTSDIKKIVMWYNLLIENEMIDFSEAQTTEEREAAVDEAVERTASEPEVSERTRESDAQEAIDEK